MISKKYIAAVIPARGSSKRLKDKNIYPVWGKPMLYWAIAACKKSKYIDDIFVSSESEKILKVAKKYNAQLIKRPKKLAKDKVLKQDVICHAVSWIKSSKKYKKPDIVISLQPNSPETKTKDLDKAMEKLVRYNRQEIFSVDKNLNQNAAFRIMTYKTVFQKSLSTSCGVFVTDYVDIHTLEDLKKVEARKKR